LRTSEQLVTPWTADPAISLLHGAGDVATLVTARPLQPRLLMSDTGLAWRARRYPLS
jgi:hypothetical protein